MKKELPLKQRKEFIKKMREICREYNAFPMAELNVVNGILEHKVYQLDLLTNDEKRGS